MATVAAQTERRRAPEPNAPSQASLAIDPWVPRLRQRRVLGWDDTSWRSWGGVSFERHDGAVIDWQVTVGKVLYQTPASENLYSMAKTDIAHALYLHEEELERPGALILEELVMRYSKIC